MRYNSDVGSWQLDDLPGCSQVCVSHSAFVLPAERGNGKGDRDHKQRLTLIKDLKYDCAIATTNAANIRQNKILINNGWIKVHEFISSKTGHSVLIWVRNF